ncbi:hypothetical protein JZ751_005253 [Albula glossodonta]|uniref:Ferlin C-terminal domain-containing protein n=1 Tax=Albula glossodonta TaxID=121402 RepID=A0A8T2P720_9TELE|nr:hypothetical protein JZ751_005253 [Albula glossodonta]
MGFDSFENRPNTSMSWLLNPMRVTCILAWRHYKFHCLGLLFISLSLLFLGLLLFSMPGALNMLSHCSAAWLLAPEEEEEEDEEVDGASAFCKSELCPWTWSRGTTGPDRSMKAREGRSHGRPRYCSCTILSISKAFSTRAFTSASFISQISSNFLASTDAKCLQGGGGN